MRSCNLLRLGLVEYGEAWDIQKDLFSSRSNNKTGDTLILLQHPPTYTFGRRSETDQPLLKEKDSGGQSVYFVDRGGGATYHGPGQIVGYPILGIKSYTTDYHIYLRMLEEVIIKTLSDFNIPSDRRQYFTGVWTDEKKIGCIGVRIIRDYTMHGFSLNVNNDLAPYDKIIPCNIKGVQLTSMAGILGREPEILSVEERLVQNFADVFKVTMEFHDPHKKYKT